MTRRALALLPLALLLGCGSEPASPPNVVLIVVDTLRADHLSLYGYERRTSEAVDALASRGWTFDRHVSSAGQTVPSTLSLLLSQHPAEHGFRHPGSGHFARKPPRYPPELLFLAEVFRDAGYPTAGYVGNPFLQSSNGFDQGFDTFVYSRRGGDILTNAALRWMKARVPDDTPFFLYLHYMDVHWPYDPPISHRWTYPRPRGAQPTYRTGLAPDARAEDVEFSIAAYDEGILFVDDQIARVVQALDELGIADDTVIALTADHGEEFLEHGGLGHGTSVYGELVRVPLVLVHPRSFDAGRRIERLTHHLDLAPTLLDLAGIERPEPFRGRSLREEAPDAFAEDGPWRAVYAGDRKLVVNSETGAAAVFDANDTLDQKPLDEEATRARLQERLDWYQTLQPTLPESARTGEAWSKQEYERLRVLGYVE